MRTCSCGNLVASNARVCPHCGRRFTSFLTKLFAILFGSVVAVGILASIFAGGTSSAPPSPAASRDLSFALVGAQRLKASMRDPDHFRLTSALVMPNNDVCYEFRSPNGYGGMTSGQAVMSGSQFKTSEMSGFAALWNKHCAGKGGEEAEAAINMRL